MDSVRFLKATAAAVRLLPPGAHILGFREVFEGPGGAWRAGIWIPEFNRFLAVAEPVEGGCPVALEVVFTDHERARGAAETLARLAAD
jgi:hypothetical protein